MRVWVLAGVLLAGCDDLPAEQLCDPPPRVSPTLQPIEDLGYVAHAFGSAGGLLATDHYSESREAFEASYADGFRVFEIDLITLADGTVIAAHDHDEHYYGLSGDFHDMTAADVDGAMWQGRYPLLYAQDLIDLLVDHPDAWMILDTKWDHVVIDQALVDLAPDDSVRDRLIPHVGSDEQAQALPGIYDFPEKMLAVYRWGGSDQQNLERLAQYGYDNIMMWWDTRWTPATQATFANAGYHVWVHSPDEPQVILDFRAQGVGVYSNGWIECGTGG